MAVPSAWFVSRSTPWARERGAAPPLRLPRTWVTAGPRELRLSGVEVQASGPVVDAARATP